MQEIIDAFNARGFIKQTVYLNHPGVWTFVPGCAYAGQKALIEPFMKNCVKLNSNSGVTFGDENWPGLMQALSHFSYHTTAGRYVLCDLQGGILKGGSSGVVLTDPVILSRDRSYGMTDLGSDGISTFFARHQCNEYCRDHWQKPRDRQVYFPANRGVQK